MMCFCPVWSFFITSERRLHNTNGATEFTSCTSIISVVSISPSFKRQLFVFLKSTCCKSASSFPSGKTSVVTSSLSKLYGICDNLAEALNPIPGSGPCQVIGIFWLEEAPVVNADNSCKQPQWSNNRSCVFFGKEAIGLSSFFIKC